MALKRINKELTDLGRYVHSPFPPGLTGVARMTLSRTFAGLTAPPKGKTER